MAGLRVLRAFRIFKSDVNIGSVSVFSELGEGRPFRGDFKFIPDTFSYLKNSYETVFKPRESRGSENSMDRIAPSCLNNKRDRK